MPQKSTDILTSKRVGHFHLGFHLIYFYKGRDTLTPLPFVIM